MKFNDFAKTISLEIIEELKSGNYVFQNAWKTLTAENFFSKRKYTGFNSFYLSLVCHRHGFIRPSFLSFKQAQQLHGNVKKGAKGVPVIYWKAFAEECKNKDEREELSKQKLFPFIHYVFNIEQIEGVNFKELENFNTTEVVSCERIINSYLDKPIIQFGGNEAYYLPDRDIVQLPPRELFYNSEGFYSTLFHELIHSTGHSSRLNRLQESFFGSELYSKEELTAELGASILCSMAGINNKPVRENHLAYLQGWIKALNNDYKLIIYAAQKAEKAVNYIVGE